MIKMNLNEIDGLQKEIEKELDRLYELSSVLHSVKTVVQYFQKNGVKGKEKVVAIRSA